MAHIQAKSLPADEALRELERSVAQHLRQSLPMYQRIAAESGFSIEFGKTTSFDHTRNAIIIGVAQLQKLGMVDPKVIDFVVLHEIGHFMELKDDPEGYLKTIKEAQARPNPDGKLYFDLYNCLQDIYVNQNSANRAPEYRRGDGFAPEIHDVYRSRAFKERDFSDRPLSVQYGQYLLNLGMGVGDDIKLADPVRQEIDAGVTLFGKHFTYPEFIDTYLVPALGHRNSYGWHATIGQRRAIIELAIVPIFEKLLEQDKASGCPLEGIPTPLDLIEADLDSLAEACEVIIKGDIERNLTPKQRSERLRNAQGATIGQAAGLTPEQALGFAETLTRVQPVIHQIVDTLKELRTSAITYSQGLLGPFNRGSDLSIEAAIENFNQVQQIPQQAEVFLQPFPIEKVEYLPKKIRLMVLPDLSGSMSEHLQDLRDVTVALAAAMVTLCQETEYAEGDLKGELGIIGFSDDALPLLEPAETVALENIAAIYPNIQIQGGTADHHALSAARDRLQRLRGANEGNDVVDILIEITDGETTDPDLSKALRKELQEMGVLVGAVKIAGGSGFDIPPDPNNPAASLPPRQITGSTYDEIWNSDGESLGKYILSSSQLAGAIREILEKTITESKQG